MSGTSSTTPPLDGCDWTPTPEQERAYAEIGAALPLLQLAQNMEHEAFTREEGTEVTDPLRTAAQALLPCPFCGSEPMEHAIEPHSHALRVGEFKMPDHHGSHVIECACGAGLIDDTRDAVASRWNKRAALAAPQLADDEQVKEHMRLVRTAMDSGYESPETDELYAAVESSARALLVAGRDDEEHAAMYRWLRKRPYLVMSEREEGGTWRHGTELDDAIRAAMKQEKQQ